MIVGEFSAALSGGSIPDGADGGEGDRQKREFLRAELGLFDGVEGEGGLVGGWFFWTLKKGDGGWDNGWSGEFGICDSLHSLVCFSVFVLLEAGDFEKGSQTAVMRASGRNRLALIVADTVDDFLVVVLGSNS